MRELVQILCHRIIYPLIYFVGSIRPIQAQKVVMIEVRGNALGSSFSVLYQRIAEDPEKELKCCYLRWKFCSNVQYLRNSIVMLWQISNAKAVFISEACTVMSSFKKRNGTNIIQLWHGCGAFKRFGYSTSEAGWGSDEKTLDRYPLYGNLDIFTVSSPEVVWAYQEATHLGKERILPVGISRTDVFFQDYFIEAAKEKLYRLIPAAKGKKVLLYAPTFRGRIATAASGMLDYSLFCEWFQEEYVLLVHHHPFVKQVPEIPENCQRFAFDVTKIMTMEELLCVADICISDYSSLVFEYSLFQKPLVFFAYDLEEYNDFRGFYYPYEEMTPGPVCRTGLEVCDYIKHVEERFDKEQIKQFADKFMSACDGNATERILEIAFGQGGKK